MSNTIFNIDIEEIKQNMELKKGWIKLYSESLKEIRKGSPLDNNLIRETEELLKELKEGLREEEYKLLDCYL